MPRAPPSSSNSKKDANSLRRNQVSAGGVPPMSEKEVGCVKAHAFALKTNSSTAGDEPTCTYDSASMDAAKIEELEAKIATLTAMLNLRDTSPSSPPLENTPPVPEFRTVPSQDNILGGLPLFEASPPGSQPISPPSAMNVSITDPFVAMTFQADLVSLFNPPLPVSSPKDTPPLSGMFSGSTGATAAPDLDFIEKFERVRRGGSASPSPSPSDFTQLIDSSWPARFPPPELLYHLVDTFFACVPHAKRVLHRPTFMNQLLEHPNSLNFPAHVVLHAICAIASLYSPIVTDGNERNMWHIGPDTLFNSAIAAKRWSGDPSNRPTRPQIYTSVNDRAKSMEQSGFGSKHAEWCMDGWLEPARTGKRIVQLLQSQLIITWYFHSVGRSVDLWVTIGTCVRMITPLGLSSMDPWGPLSRQPYHTLVMAPQAPTPEQMETLRNIFWLTYTNERVLTAGTVWPLMMQDDDISQLFPVRGKDFPGTSIPVENRQRLTTSKSLVTHPPELTDSFTLYIKASILLGKVKTLNGRFRLKYESGGGAGDPRETTEFQMLDSAIQRFKTSIPKDLCEFISVDGKVDPTLHMALLLPNVAMIILHDPHATIESPNCMSAERILTAARAILDDVYKLTATSFDLLLLDHACSFGWFVCATALMRFLRVKILAGDEAAATKLGAEIQVARFMLGNLGERTICGLRQIMILERLYAQDIEPLMPQGPNAMPPIVTPHAPPNWHNMTVLGGTGMS
ncbi:hypothetical protein FRB96_009452 [Tulasnella sp. 330]|nr:hypothetical protein FRB96_009452 [Tulasnella sp. 330]